MEKRQVVDSRFQTILFAENKYLISSILKPLLHVTVIQPFETLVVIL